jgi:SAM-dependent methyltransferase
MQNSIPKWIRSRVPEQVKANVVPGYVYVRDLLFSDPFNYLASNLSGKPVPPRHLIRLSGIGGNVRAFEEFGRKQLRYCLDLASLKPDNSVLEVGCGMGRLAWALTRYLNSEGSYEGIDVTKVAIGWCQRKIASKHPNFLFHLVDAFNGAYNPGGKISQSVFSFPYGDESFDLVYSYSVFTHMILEDVARYLTEIHRVLKTGQTCVNSFLLLNAESLSLIEKGQSQIDLKHQHGRSLHAAKGLPESTIGHDEEDIRIAYRKSGLRIAGPIHYGSWPGRSLFLGSQDIIVAQK